MLPLRYHLNSREECAMTELSRPHISVDNLGAKCTGGKVFSSMGN